MKSVDYKAKLFEMIVCGKGIQYVMDACANLLGNPFVFANRSLQLVSKCSACDRFPEVFGWFEENHEEYLKVANEANKAGYFKAIYASDKPVYGTITGIPVNWIAARVRLKDQILGNILVSDCQNPFTGEYEEMLPLICQTIAFVLQQSNHGNSEGYSYEALLTELLEGRYDFSSGEDSARKLFKLLGQKLPVKMRVLIMRTASSEYTVKQVILDAQLRSQFPLSLGIIYKNDCVRILDAGLSQESIEERLSKNVSTERSVCGISRIIASAMSLHDAYLQADAAVRLGKKTRNRRLFHFDDVFGPYLLEQVTTANNMSAGGFIMPEILTLLESGDSTCFEKIQDLAAYMSCGRNVTRAAEIRGIHKNSMYYRLDRIMEFTHLALNNDDVCVQVTLSLAMLGFLPFRPFWEAPELFG